MRQILSGLGLVTLLASPLVAQRAPAAPVQAVIDEFVLTMRDQAAWALVTPAAYVPVGAIEDVTGKVATVVGVRSAVATATPDSVLDAFRVALNTAARRGAARTVGLAYMATVMPPGQTTTVSAVVVEVAHRSGYRANVYFPYVYENTEQPVFSAPFSRPGLLQGFTTKR